MMRLAFGAEVARYRVVHKWCEFAESGGKKTKEERDYVNSGRISYLPGIMSPRGPDDRGSFSP